MQAGCDHLSNGDSHPLAAQVEMAFRLKHGEAPFRWSTTPWLRRRFGYFTPDDIYEGLVAQLVVPGSSWLDVGGGRRVFPENPRLARLLADRCRLLVGVDPSDNIRENPFVHEHVQCMIEEYQARQPFDLATLRMMAEHITRPVAAVNALARLIRPGGRVVVYTVNLWSPLAFLAWLVPFRLHHGIKSLLWRTEEKDSFPVAYAMNTHSRLKALFTGAGFRELSFAYLDDCRIFHRFPALSVMETGAWKALHALGMPYPESCLLGVYQRSAEG